MASADEVKDLFPAMVERLIPDKAAGIDATILFDPERRQWRLILDQDYRWRG